MALRVKAPAKGHVRFEVSDDDAETVITLEPDDTEEAIIRKLKRVITLVEGKSAAWAASHHPVVGPVLAAKAAPPPVTGNGWAAYVAAPELPDRLQGEVELIEPEEKG